MININKERSIRMAYGDYDRSEWDNSAGVSRRSRDRQDYGGNRLSDQQSFEDEYQDYDGRQLYYRSRPQGGRGQTQPAAPYDPRGERNASRARGARPEDRRPENRRPEERMSMDRSRSQGNPREQRNEDDWAGQVRQNWQRGPYRDYGWESGESALPEFRDPDIHRMPYDEEDEGQQQQGRGRRGPDFRRAYDAQNASHLPTGEMPTERGYGSGYDRTAWWNVPGPHAGRGPRGYQRSNERIQEDIYERLTVHGQIDATDVEVRVDNGEVTLTGQVSDRRAKRLAEDVAESVNGVRDVHNELRLRSQEAYSQQGSNQGFGQQG
jgi:hypothetical protein